MEDLKNLGNQEFANHNYKKALAYYEKALDLDQDNHILHSNCCAVHTKLKNQQSALKSGIKCTRLAPKWSKGWSRLGSALLLNNNTDKALIAFKQSLELDPNNTTSKNMISTIAHKQDSDTEEESDDEKQCDYSIDQTNDTVPPNLPHNLPPNLPMSSNMGDLFGKILSNPKISEKMKDATFQSKLVSNQSNPMAMLNDPDMMEIMQEMMKDFKFPM